MNSELYALCKYRIGLLSPILLTLSVAVIIGLIAGIYPAQKAAYLNPIDALRKV